MFLPFLSVGFQLLNRPYCPILCFKMCHIFSVGESLMQYKVYYCPAETLKVGMGAYAALKPGHTIYFCIDGAFPNVMIFRVQNELCSLRGMNSLPSRIGRHTLHALFLYPSNGLLWCLQCILKVRETYQKMHVHPPPCTFQGQYRYIQFNLLKMSLLNIQYCCHQSHLQW